jgi:sulfite exporter TauE/SafE
MPGAISLAVGAALGLASSLHCVGMCGGIAVLFGYSPGGCSAAAAGKEQALLHGGRIASYALLGAMAGGLGNAAFGGIDAGSGQALMRWAAALSLGWMGLVTAGMAPAPALLAHGAGTGRWRMRLMLHFPAPARRIAGGLLWGLLPCGMVYAALLYALFAGTALGGALVMLGFGLGTLPALALAGLGFRSMQTALRTRGAAQWLGAAMVAIGFLSLLESPAALGGWCARLAGHF